MNKLFDAVGNKSVLIIDLYDALLVRLLRNSPDLFHYIEQYVQMPGFYEARMNAEQAFSNNEQSFPALDAIYKKMHHSYQHIQEIEADLNLITTRVNPEIKQVFDKAIQNNIPVYLCGNSGLPRSRIETFLEQNGCSGYRKLYLSLTDVAMEDMYEEIIRESSVSPSAILHITSNSNYLEKEKHGVTVFGYEPLYRRYGLNRNSSFFAVLNRYQKNDILIPMLESNIAISEVLGKLKDNWFEFGYKYIGLLAFEFAKYIGEIVKNLGIKKLYFSSENGYCLRSAFELLYPEIESEIISFSKRTFIFSGIHDEHDAASKLLQSIKTGTTFRAWITWLYPECECELYQSYTSLFPNQNRIICSEDFGQLRCFITENIQYFLDEAEKARASLEGMKILEDSAAVVDVGSHMNLVSGLKQCREIAEHDLVAFWWEYAPTVCWKSGLLSNIKINTAKPNTYLHRILTLALSEPQMRPDSSCESDYEEQRIVISRKIFAGAMECVRDLYETDKSFPLPHSKDGAMAICEYLQEYIDQKGKSQLEQAYSVSDSLDLGYVRPLFRQDRPVIGIMNPWPEDVSAEAEVITRIKRAADENQIECVLLDRYGHILNDKQKQTKGFIKDEDLSFIITTHYECAKVRNVFYYNPLWNPPEIPLNLSDYTPRVANYFMMNDDFLIYDSGGMSNHLRSVLMNCPRTLKGASALTASFPASAALPPKLDKPVMFYCGMNWEVMFGGAGRHDGLFKLLDDTQKVKFYGPERVEAWGGLKPWDGYHCYQGMIPFDGFSILERINECGICLVLSSDTHRRAGAATNRLYEACAAGAVIISDDNEFVLEHFQDAALFIKFNKKDPIDTFRQIMEKYEWITKHPEKALQLARRAQEIYLKEYSLDVQLNQIIANHPARFKQLSQDLYAQNEEGKVLVTFVLDSQAVETAENWLDCVIRNLHGQLYQNMELAIAVDKSIAAEITDYCETRCACAHVVAMPLFDAKGVRALTDGEAIRNLQQAIPHAYYINTTAEEVWFFDHITSLVRAVTDHDCMGAYSGSSFEDTLGLRRINFFDLLNVSYLYYMNRPDYPLAAGQFLFKADAHDLVPDYLFDSLDGKEHIAYAGIIHYQHNAKLAFTKRMSLCYSKNEKDNRCAVLSDVMQCRFIKDLLRFHIPEQALEVPEQNSAPAGNMDKRSLTDLLLFIPIKIYLRLRYYRFQMRRKEPGSKQYNKYSEKYDACLEQYRQYWNV